ncbi:MAG: efflux RND transporter permease subunit [bacterium]
MNIQKDSVTNPIVLSKRVRGSLERIESDLPPGYGFSVINDMSELILDAIKGLSKLAAFGIVLALVVIFLFVHDAKVTATLALVIPICVIATFNLMYFGNLTINIVTLVGLAVGLGALVDNGIVVLENVFRHYERGMPPEQAAIRGTNEVSRAIFGLTITNVAVFLPVIFIEDWIRIIFQEGALAVIFPMLISAMVALLLVPMVAARVLRVTRRERRSRLKEFFFGFNSIAFVMQGLRRIPRPNMPATRRFYGNLLKSCLRHRVRLAIAILLLLLYTYFYSMGGIGMGTMKDPEDSEGFQVYVFTPRGTKQSFTVNVCAKVEELIKEHVPEKKHIRSWVSDDDAEVYIELVDRSERDREVPEIKEGLRQYFDEIPEAEVTFEWWRRRRGEEPSSPVIQTGGGVIEVRGSEQAQLERLVNEVLPLIEQIPGIRDVTTDLEQGPMEMHFRPDRDTAALLQITPQSIAWHLQAAQRRGDFSTIRLKREEEEIDIVFQQVTEDRSKAELDPHGEGLTLQEMRELPIFAPTLMTTVPLEDIGVFEQVRGPGWIQRQNQTRIVRIRYGLTPSAKQRQVDEMLKSITENYPLPAGMTMQIGGSSYEWGEMLSSVKMVVWVSILLVYMILAAILESFATPLVIMISEPLALVGIVWALLLTDTPFDELAGFGVIFLVGVLPNSPLLLLHFVQVMRRERSFPRERAMMLAGYSRLRPILMTVGTTVLGLLPMAFETTDNATWVPFARVAIGGLLTSTILTLIIVPGVYFGVEDLVRLLSRYRRWVTSWRWLLVFWSGRRRMAVRERLTSYRREPPREEPLIIQTKNLTRIYEPPLLERVRATAIRLAHWGPAGGPVVGLLPYERPRLGPAIDRKQQGVRARKKALAGIELRVESGMFGLLGPNGAGKTTFLRLLSGVDRPTRGFISVLGYDYARELKLARKQIGYLPQEFGAYSALTAEKYLDYLALLKGMRDKRERRSAIDQALDMVNLSHVRDVPVGNFSGGMMRRIGLAQIFLHPPKVLIVDEPTAGLDPLERVRFRNLLTGLAVGRIVILSTHIVEDVAHSCPRLAVLQNGQVTFSGGTRELARMAEGKVWEMLTVDDSLWRQIHTQFSVVSQIQTAQGIRMRIVSQMCPHPEARNVPPTLEDAYILHTAEESDE